MWTLGFGGVLVVEGFRAVGVSKTQQSAESWMQAGVWGLRVLGL